MISSLVRKYKAHMVMKDISNAIRKSSGVGNFTADNLRDFLVSVYNLSSTAGSGNRWYDLAKLVLGPRAKEAEYREIEQRLIGHPVANVLHQWEVLPLLHTILQAEEVEFGFVSRQANQVLARRIEEVLPEKYTELLGDARLITGFLGKDQTVASVM